MTSWLTWPASVYSLCGIASGLCKLACKLPAAARCTALIGAPLASQSSTSAISSSQCYQPCPPSPAGFFFGRTPLIKLSPKKTWEGFLGGCVGTGEL